jgi:hypothetical protein
MICVNEAAKEKISSRAQILLLEQGNEQLS